MTSTLAKSFICERRVETINEIVEPVEELFYDPVEFAQNLRYLGVRLNGGSANKNKNCMDKI